MIRIFFILITIATLVSCTSNTIYKEPEDLIPKELMIKMLTDIYIANSANTSPNKLEKRQIQYLPLVYKKYKIDSAQFKRSNIYYTSKLNDYKYIYQEVVKNLEELKSIYELPAIKYDSIQKTKRDSIKKAFINQKKNRKEIIIKRAQKTKFN